MLLDWAWTLDATAGSHDAHDFQKSALSRYPLHQNTISQVSVHESILDKLPNKKDTIRLKKRKIKHNLMDKTYKYRNTL
jgi:hypothetical protein